jgi:hypothetical protein
LLIFFIFSDRFNVLIIKIFFKNKKISFWCIFKRKTFWPQPLPQSQTDPKAIRLGNALMRYSELLHPISLNLVSVETSRAIETSIFCLNQTLTLDIYRAGELLNPTFLSSVKCWTQVHVPLRILLGSVLDHEIFNSYRYFSFDESIILFFFLTLKRCLILSKEMRLF